MASAAQPVTTGSLITASMDFTPKLMKDPSLFKAILDGAFSFRKPHAAKPAPQETQDEAAGDPDEIIPFNGRNVPRWLVHSILKAAHVTGVDPVYMIMLIQILGPEYVVWDKKATIRFRKPGRSTLFARFVLEEDEIRTIRELVEKNPSIDREYRVDLVDAAGLVHAEVEKTVYIRKKAGKHGVAPSSPVK